MRRPIVCISIFLTYLLCGVLFPRVLHAQPVIKEPFVCAGVYNEEWLLPHPQAKIAQGSPSHLTALIIFARFANEAPEDSLAPPYAEDLFDPELPGSLSHFYDRMSFGQFGITGTFLPTRYASFHDVAYYLMLGLDAGREPFGFFNQEILRQADQDVDFGRFDNDGPDGIPNSGDDDGMVDFVFINLRSVVEGFLKERATGIQSLGLHEDYVTDDASASGGSIHVRRGATERVRWFADAAGVMAHELGHWFGLPDLYDLTPGDMRSEDSAGIGNWGLMGYGATGWHGNDGPVPFCAWSRERLGWIGEDNANLVVLDRPMRDVGIDHVEVGGKVYKMPVSKQEYFLIEHRLASSERYDRNIPASGLLIWHIGPWASNRDEQRKWVDLECADGLYADYGYPQGQVPDAGKGRDNLDYWASDGYYRAEYVGNLGDATDVFDGVRYVEFGPDTNPSSAADDGSYTGHRVEHIRRDGDRMVADLIPGPGQWKTPLTYSRRFVIRYELLDGNTDLDNSNALFANGDRAADLGELVGVVALTDPEAGAPQWISLYSADPYNPDPLFGNGDGVANPSELVGILPIVECVDPKLDVPQYIKLYSDDPFLRDVEGGTLHERKRMSRLSGQYEGMYGLNDGYFQVFIAPETPPGHAAQLVLAISGTTPEQEEQVIQLEIKGDDTTPPHIAKIQQNPVGFLFDVGDTIAIRCRFYGGERPKRVHLNVLNVPDGQQIGQLHMEDDGQHNDHGADDSVYGTTWTIPLASDFGGRIVAEDSALNRSETPFRWGWLTAPFETRASVLLCESIPPGKESAYADALDAMHIPYDLWNRYFIGSQGVMDAFSQYTEGLVILTKSLREGTDSLERYLEEGGSLFLSGRASSWSFLLKNCFYTRSEGFSARPGMLEGIVGDPITDGLRPLELGARQSLSHTLPATSILKDEAGKSYGVKVSTADYRGVFLGFDPVDIKDVETKQTLLRRIIGWLAPSIISSDVHGVEAFLPSTYALHPNVPNPFNAQTTIRYEVPMETRIALSIYSISGQKIRTLTSGAHKLGIYTITWDGTDEEGRRMGSGVYLYRLVCEGFRSTRKLVLIH